MITQSQAILTGDIVSSGKIENRIVFNEHLKVLFKEVSGVLNPGQNIEIFRGDSFQTLVAIPENSLVMAILLRAGIRSLNLKFETKDQAYIPDARISIGIGKVDYHAESIMESDGPAFQNSGKGLDQISNTRNRLMITSSLAEFNEEFKVSTAFADIIISNWSPATSQAIYYTYLFKKTQKDLSEFLNISQPAVHKRLSIAHFDKIELFLNRFKQALNQMNL